MDNEPHNRTNLENPDFTRQPVFWQLVILMGLLILIFSSAIVGQLSDFTSIATPPQPTPGRTQGAAVITSAPHTNTDLSHVRVVAEAAFVYDVAQQKVLYEKNANQPLPLASVSKLMTALVAHEILDEDTNITIDLAAIKQDGDSGLLAGEEFSFETLNDLVLMTSSNDGAFAMAEAAGTELIPELGSAAFIEAMNIRASQLGLDSLAFKNPTGLDINETTPGAVGSAHDVARLMEHIITTQPEILTATKDLNNRFYNEAGAYHNAQNTNATVKSVSGLIGSKTGYTNLAGGNLAIAYNAGLNHPIVVVVLGSTRTERFTDVLTLVNELNSSFIAAQ